MAKCILAGRALAVAGFAFLWVHPLKGAEWIVIQVTGMEPRVMVVEKVEDKDGMVTLRDAKGIALGAWQKEFVVGRATLLPESRDTWTVDLIRRQVGELEAFVAQHPITASRVNPALKEAQLYLKQEEAKAAALEAEKKARLQKRLETLLAAAAPTPAAVPPLADLEAHVGEGQALLKEVPAEAARLEEHLKPWTEIRDAVAAGKIWFEESWKTEQEKESILEARRQEVRDRILGKAAHMEVSAVVISADMMKKIQTGVAAGLGIGALAVLVLLFWKTSTSTMIHTKTQGNVRLNRSNTVLSLLKGVILIASLVLVTIEGFYVYNLWLYPPGAVALEVEPETSDELARMIYACSQPEGLKAEDVPQEPSLGAEALTRHFAKNLVFNPAGDEGALVRTAWAVEVSPQSVIFQENLRCGTRTWTARYEIKLVEQATGTHFTTGRMTVDGWPVPNLLGSHLWNSFQAELRQWAKNARLDSHYAFAGVSKNKLKFKLTTPPTVTPIAAPTPSSPAP